MKLRDMINELIELGDKQVSIVAWVVENTDVNLNQGTISKIINYDRDPGYTKGKAIERYYNLHIKKLRKKSAASCGVVSY